MRRGERGSFFEAKIAVRASCGLFVLLFSYLRFVLHFLHLFDDNKREKRPKNENNVNVQRAIMTSPRPRPAEMNESH